MAYEDSATQAERRRRQPSDDMYDGAGFLSVMLLFIGVLWAAVNSNIQRERRREAERAAAASQYQQQLREEREHEPASQTSSRAEQLQPTDGDN